MKRTFNEIACGIGEPSAGVTITGMKYELPRSSGLPRVTEPAIAPAAETCADDGGRDIGAGPFMKR